MADIKQAALWLQQGKRVRRESWENTSFFLVEVELQDSDSGATKRIEPFDEGGEWEIDSADLLADDWEVA